MDARSRWPSLILFSLDVVRTRVEFRSDKFPPNAGEEERVNPGVWGERLAQYLYEQFEARGVEVDDYVAEDWGYCIRLVPKEFMVWIGCGHQADAPEAFLCFVEPSKPWIRKFPFRKIDTTAEVSRVVDVLGQILTSDPQIHQIRWLSEDEQ